MHVKLKQIQKEPILEKVFIVKSQFIENKLYNLKTLKTQFNDFTCIPRCHMNASTIGYHKSTFYIIFH